MNNTKYSEFHQIHIPKTAGTLLCTFLNANLTPILLKNNFKIFGYNEQTMRHHGWGPVTENQYLVSSFRNPSKRMVSHFFQMLSHPAVDNIKVTRENRYIYDIGSRVNNYEQPTKNEFFNWIEKNDKWLSNYQSKNFFYRADDLFIPKCILGLAGPLSIKDFNKPEVLDNIKRVNLLIKSENLKTENFENILNKILNDYNLKNDKPINLDYNNRNRSKKSFEFYNSLSLKEVEYIESLNTLDLEIYNTESFFWDPKSII